MVLSSKKIATELKANNKSTYTNRFLASVLSKFFSQKLRRLLLNTFTAFVACECPGQSGETETLFNSLLF